MQWLIVCLTLLHQTLVPALKLCKEAKELGEFEISQWSSASSFADPTARWLAATNSTARFFYKYRNVHQSPVSGKLHVLGNAYFLIEVNGVSVGNVSGSRDSDDYTKVPVRFGQVSEYDFFSCDIRS